MSDSRPDAHRPKGALGPALFVLAISLSAFLIFLVQPMVGKRILPWFGGAPGVWTVCLAFYQTALFAGYAYAHLLIRFAPPATQLGIHAVVVLAALLAPSVLPDLAHATGDPEAPIGRILAMLSSHVALPFLVLASTGPLVQAWFARRYPNQSPYPLYAVSNLGSMLALLAYPFLIEPRLGLEQTGSIWGIGFAVAMLVVLGTGALARTGSTMSRETGPGPHEKLPGDDRVAPSVDASLVGLWFGLSGAAVVMLNGLTNRLCLDIASVPFLWILPLATYLATFILCFASERFYRRDLSFLLVFGLLAVSTFSALLSGAAENELSSEAMVVDFGSLPLVVAYYAALLFGLCMILHGELYRLRPAVRSLTTFYLCVSAGGAMGGLLVGVAAPMLFDGYGEFGWGLVTSLALGTLAVVRSRGGWAPSLRAVGAPARVAIVVALLLMGAEVWQVLRPNAGAVEQERNFFGVLRVVEQRIGEETTHVLLHGSTLHGVQIQSEKGRRIPTSYYGRASSLAGALASRPGDGTARIGVVGLGVGTIATYAREGELMRFYEIDPAVVRVARDDGDFSYLAESAATVEVELGDARLLLEGEQQRGEAQDFDVLVIDAFSSDSVPVHLLTREAFAIYRKALASGGLLAVHVSNRYFELSPLVAALGREVGLEHLQVWTRAVPDRQTTESRWVYLAEDAQRLEKIRPRSNMILRRLGVDPRAQHFSRSRASTLDRTPLWTDDYSDLFGVLND